MDKSKRREMIARRSAMEFVDGTIVNLGIGLPTLCANFIPEDVNIMLQSENGFIGIGQLPEGGREDFDLVNAGGAPVTMVKGGSTFDSATSFGIIRGGHVHTTVLGALQVDEEGNLANWMVPGKMVSGMGGAMDLVVGAKKVIIAMEHTAKGSPKILKKCILPLTAVKVVDLIITDMAVIEVTEEGLVLREIAPDVTVEEVVAATEASLIVSKDIKIIDVV